MVGWMGGCQELFEGGEGVEVREGEGVRCHAYCGASEK